MNDESIWMVVVRHTETQIKQQSNVVLVVIDARMEQYFSVDK